MGQSEMSLGKAGMRLYHVDGTSRVFSLKISNDLRICTSKIFSIYDHLLRLMPSQIPRPSLIVGSSIPYQARFGFLPSKVPFRS
jgi:hypothetical protein